MPDYEGFYKIILLKRKELYAEKNYYLFIYEACDIPFFRDYLLFAKTNYLFLIVFGSSNEIKSFYIRKLISGNLCNLWSNSFLILFLISYIKNESVVICVICGQTLS